MLIDDPLAQDAEAGFLDVAANALAVVIFATMMVLIVSVPPLVAGAVREAPLRDPVMPTPMAPVPVPFSAFHYVTEAGIAPIDLRAAVDHLSDREVVGTMPGTVSFRTERTRYRDLDDYNFTLTPDRDALRAGAVDLQDREAMDAFVQHMDTLVRQDRTVPAFVVTEAGYASFVPIHAALRAHGVPLRWFFVPELEQIILRRVVDDFETEVSQFQ